jgi:hypothetical protein
MKRILVICTLLAVSLTMFAQEKAAPKKTATKPAAQPAGMPPLPKPGPEMKKLISSLSGDFTATMKMDAMMGMPAMTSIGPAKAYSGPGRLSLMENVNSVDEHGMKMNGHGIIWWDAKAGGYKGVWCDNGTPSGCMDSGTGKWDGDKLVFTGTMDMMGKNYNFKSTYSDFTPDGYNFLMETGEGTAPLAKMFTVEYKKAAPAAKPAAPGK